MTIDVSIVRGKFHILMVGINYDKDCIFCAMKLDPGDRLFMNQCMVKICKWHYNQLRDDEDDDD